MQGVFIVAIPAFAMCMALEWAWCARRALKPGYEARDTAASLAMGAGSVVSVELDSDAIQDFQDNISEFEIDNIEVIQGDVTNLPLRYPAS